MATATTQVACNNVTPTLLYTAAAGVTVNLWASAGTWIGMSAGMTPATAIPLVIVGNDPEVQPITLTIAAADTLYGLTMTRPSAPTTSTVFIQG
jgi:hypothetical protein